ncbi:MAG: division/cell wall cluster transcriptional repressor MraZ [Bacteroidales bacterium]|nr:division/cell wall cluster transcriptional repressor MraZ [Bacteroidales bacterium]
MAKFIGEYSAKLDDKGRLVFPAALKALADPDLPLRFVVKKDLFSPCLEMYSYDEWEKQSEAVKSRLNPSFNREHAVFWRAYMSNRAVVEPDEKTGRILIPKHLLNMIGIKREVVFAGADFKIELWPKESYQASLISEDKYVSLAEKLLS